MRTHHLNAGTMRPQEFEPSDFVCHCVLIDRDGDLILIDTGIGLRDIDDPRVRLHDWFVSFARPVLDPTEAVAHQVERLGYGREQVRDIVLTHLDRDHAGGLADFPAARIHASPMARAAALCPSAATDRDRIQVTQWVHGPVWGAPPIPVDEWFGLPAWRLPDLGSTEILLVDLPGHGTGHAGVAFVDDGRWWLHAGDGYFHHDQLDDPDNVSPGVVSFTQQTQHDEAERLGTEDVLRHLRRGNAVTVFSAHDPSEMPPASWATGSRGTEGGSLA